MDDSIYTTAKPFYFLLKLLGIFPFSIETSSGEKVFRPKLLDYLSCCFSITSLLFALFMSIEFTDVMNSSSEIVARAWNLNLTFCLFTVLISLCYQIQKRNQIVKFLQLIDDFDKKVNFKSKSLTNYSKNYI